MRAPICEHEGAFLAVRPLGKRIITPAPPLSGTIKPRDIRQSALAAK